MEKKSKSHTKKKRFKVFAPANGELKFWLADGQHSVSDLQDYFRYFIKQHERVIDNSLIRINVNQLKNRIKFTIMTGYCLELLTPETMKLLRSTRSEITKDDMHLT